MNIYNELKTGLERILIEKNISDAPVTVRTRVLTPRESLGNTTHDDYPQIKGKEKLLMAEFKGSRGVAFTDMYGDYQGLLYEIIDLELKNNFTRAIFISTLNAVLRNLKIINGTEHCRDNEPINCAGELKEFISTTYKSY